MKKRYTYEQITDVVKLLDKRALSMSDAQLNSVIDDGYSELVVVCNSAFSDEDVVDLTEYYDMNEMKLTMDVEADVVDIYDLYVAVDGPEDIYQGGVKTIHDELVIYRDSRYAGRFHIDLNASTYGQLKNAVCKYYYTPQATTEDVFIDSITMSALKSAFNVAISKQLHDTKRAKEYLGDLHRLASKIPSTEPEDVQEQCNSIFA